MIITTKAAHLFSMVSGTLAGFAASTGATASDAGPLTSIMIAAACAGSASAILFLLIDNKDRPPETIFRRIVKHLIGFFLGAGFGLFVGPSIAGFTPLDTLAGIYFGGVIGFGVIGFVTSPSTIRKLGDWLVDKITNGSSGKDK